MKNLLTSLLELFPATCHERIFLVGGCVSDLENRASFILQKRVEMLRRM